MGILSLLLGPATVALGFVVSNTRGELLCYLLAVAVTTLGAAVVVLS